MQKLIEILRPIVDGIRKQHIHGITMIFYKKTDLNTVDIFASESFSLMKIIDVDL